MRTNKLIAGLMALVSGFSIQMLCAAPGDVTACVKSPCKNPIGLAGSATHLYVSDWRSGQIHEIDPENGDVSRTWTAPTDKPFGLTFAEGYLYICDDYTGRVYALNLETNKVDRHFEAPGKRARGLAFDDGVLFILESQTGKVYRVVPEDGTILGYFPLPDKDCANLAHDGDYLWVSNRVADEVYMLDADTGMVINVLDAPGPYAAGLTWFRGELWNVDYQEDVVYEVATRDVQKYSLAHPRDARVEYTWDLTNFGPGQVEDLVVNLAIPENLPNQEILSPVEYAVKPTRVDRDRWLSPCALYELNDVAAGESTGVSYTVDVRVSAIRYLIIPEEVGTLDQIPQDIRSQYTGDGTRFRINSPYIQRLVKELVGDEKNPYWIARRIYNHLITQIKYEYVGGWDVPEVVLRRGTGSCSEYAFCMVALCRAAGIPARYQGSSVWRKDAASIDEPFHRWAQVYLPNYGWIPVDASRGAHESPVVQAKCFGQLANEFLITTHSGGDSEYLHWGYNHYANYKLNGRCRVEENNFGFWEPLGTGDEPKYLRRSSLFRSCQP